jgi:hypothetical protein
LNDTSWLSRLEAAGPLDPTTSDQVVGRVYSHEELLAARAGTFTFLGGQAVLAPPVDWTQDPIGSRSWRYHLHTLQCLAPLLSAWRRHGDRSALEQALAIGVDWVRSNGRGAEGISEFAWYDMAVGIRAGILAYLIRAAALEQLLDEATAAESVRSVIDHGVFLAADENYASGHNHGLFQDEGLLLLSERLPFIGEAAGWQETAARRLLDTLAKTVSSRDGVHLEHSPAYHFVILNMVRRLTGRPALSGGALHDLLRRLEETAAWLVAPDGTLPEVGDTDPVSVPAWAAEAAAGVRGMRTFMDTGYAAVRRGGSYLLVSAGYHSHGHKHADELSFVLHENGVRIVGDTGRYGYYENEPGRQHARSSSAHNVLLVDGDFTWRGNPSYGSALVWARAEGEWYAVEGTNPLIEPEARHRRLFLYRPSSVLLIVDEVESNEPRTHTRLLHFGASVELRPGVKAIELAAPGVRGHLTEWSSTETAWRIAEGQIEPRMQGWTFPSDRRWVPVPTVELEGRASAALYATVLSFGDQPATVTHAESLDDRTRVEIELEGRRWELTCSRSEDRLTSRPVGPAPPSWSKR